MTADAPGVDPNDGITEPAEVETPGFFKRMHTRAHANPVTGLIFKIVVTILGLALVIVGVIMIFTPGQGILSIIAGLALLSLEYQWAERALHKAKERAQAARDKLVAVDPAVRRRRRWTIIGVLLCFFFVWGGWLSVYGYPGWLTSGWDYAQNMAGWLPELPELPQRD